MPHSRITFSAVAVILCAAIFSLAGRSFGEELTAAAPPNSSATVSATSAKIPVPIAEPSPLGRGQGEGAEASVGNRNTSQQPETLTPTLSHGERESSVRAKVRTVAMELLNSSHSRPTTKFGIELDAVNNQAADRPLVIVIHGYNSCPERMAALQKSIRDAGYICGTFRYPNDQAIPDSASLLSSELASIKKQHPNQRIVLVTHSMGGLVAREAIENPALDPGNVSQLIMIAPPSHGTSCAYITLSGDVWEHYIRSHDHNVLDYLYSSLEDGLGEGRNDLKPGSVFLKQLNDRPRNANVHYTIFLGTGTMFTRTELDHARRILDKCCQADAFLSVIRPAFERAITDLDDSVEVGDGVVSVARGKLDGVSDTTLLGFDHWNVLGEPKPEPVAALHREILKRLSATP